MRKRHERVLGDVKDLIRDLRDRANDTYSIKVKYMKTSNDLERMILDLMEAQ